MDKQELVQLYVHQKLNQSQIGKIYGVNRKTISYYLKKYNIPTRTRKEVGKMRRRQDITIEAIEYMIFVCGLLVDEVADYYHVSRTCISERLKENGYNLRNHLGQRLRQSEMMSVNNPVPKGSKRTPEIGEAVRKAKEEQLNHKIKTFEPSSFREYSRFARFLSYKAFGKKVPNGYEIDHIFSIKDGWENKVPVNIISGKFNLQLLPSLDNKKKNSKSEIGLDELYRRAGVQRLELCS